MILWHLLFIIFFFIFVIESGKIRPNFDEIFGDGWNKKERDEHLVKSQQNERKENSQSASVDQMGEEMGNDPIDQMENDQKKREIIKKFDEIKEKLKEKIKYKGNDYGKFEIKIAKLLGTNRKLIQKWKNKLNLNKNKIKKQLYDEKKRKFIERFDEFKEFYGQGKQKEFATELGICEDTFCRWKKQLAPNYHISKKQYTNEDKFEKMKQCFEIKEVNPKMSDVIITKKLEIGFSTLNKWKKECS